MPPNPFVREDAPAPRDAARDVFEAEAAGIDLTQATMRSDQPPAAARERSTSDKLKDAALDASDVLSIVSGLFGRAGL